MSYSLGRFTSMAAMLVASSATIWAQSSPVGHLSGTIKGADGKPIVGQLVAIQTSRGNLQARSDAKGQFLVPNLIPGKISVIVHARDMADFKADANIVVNQLSTLNIVLHPAAQAVVEVVSESTVLTVDSNLAKTGLVTDFHQVDELPIGAGMGDRLSSVVMLTPGANNFIMHGMDEYQNNYQVDGVDTTSGNYGGSISKLNDDFIDQVQVLTSGVSARYGRFQGSQVNVTTKSGSNEFDGSVRLDITNPKWNSRPKISPVYALYGITLPQPEDHHSITQSYTFMGPIIKDKLFFAGAYQLTTPMTMYKTATTSLQWGGVPYTGTSDETRKDLKVDWVVNPSNRLFFTANETQRSMNNMTVSSGSTTSLATLDGRSSGKMGYWAVGYTSQLASNILLDMKYNDAYSKGGGPGDGPTGGKTVPTWMDVKTRDIFDNGFGSDAATNTHQRMATVSSTGFFDWHGQHQLEVGFQGYEYTYDSAAQRVPSGNLIYFDGFAPHTDTSDIANRALAVQQADLTRLISYQSVAGHVKSQVNSFYVNDLWTLDSKWSLNLGARYDRYDSKSTPENNNFNFSVISPRFSVNYNLEGDGSQIVSLSAAEYAGMVLQGQLASASVSQTPIERDYVYVGTGGSNQGRGSDALTAAGAINWAAWGNLSGATGYGNPATVLDPLTNRNVFVDSNLKAPRTRELTLGYRYERNQRSFSVTFIRRVSDNYLDDFWYGNGVSAGVPKVVIKTDPDSRMNYNGLEVTFRQAFNENLSFGGNFTWSRALGNAGETLNGSSAQSHNFGENIPENVLSPYGPIPGVDRPLSGNLDLTYHHPLGSGIGNVGLVGTYRGRTCSGFAYGDASTPDNLVAQGYALNYSKFYPQFGPFWDPSFFQLNMQFGYDQKIWNKVHLSVKANIENVLNWKPVENYYHIGTVGVDGSYVPMPVLDGMALAYQTGRSIALVTGLKF
jgi:hypothetical protein